MAKSSVTADELQVYMEEGNPMGIQSNQHYSLFVGGWEWPCISANSADIAISPSCFWIPGVDRPRVASFEP